ncbi:hypothetical protein KP509_01G124900 [Ceratopteris richardii]|uniref:Uncharacterized protein n=1 Tax=Ceratopteris richardii TaxID=49495 RepID=A0A8T2VKU2_CERRI|nr:hypothetical protein KP509_01G124900 [Ceratopteris richardii]
MNLIIDEKHVEILIAGMWRKGIEYGGASPVGPTSSRNDGGAKSISTSTIPLSLGNPFGTELKRRRRVASYKAYTVEGRIKFSLRSGVRWIKNKYLDIRYGWW